MESTTKLSWHPPKAQTHYYVISRVVVFVRYKACSLTSRYSITVFLLGWILSSKVIETTWQPSRTPSVNQACLCLPERRYRSALTGNARSAVNHKSIDWWLAPTWFSPLALDDKYRVSHDRPLNLLLGNPLTLVIFAPSERRNIPYRSFAEAILHRWYGGRRDFGISNLIVVLYHQHLLTRLDRRLEHNQRLSVWSCVDVVFAGFIWCSSWYSVTRDTTFDACSLFKR